MTKTANVTIRLLAAVMCAVLILGMIPCLGIATEAETEIPGDVDLDGGVTNTDLALLIRYLSGWQSALDLDSADYDGNGRVNNRDAMKLIADILSTAITLPDIPEVTSDTVGYIAYGATSGLCTSSDENDGKSDSTSKHSWGLLASEGTQGVMSLLPEGGTAVVTGRGMIGVDYRFTRAATPVLITAVYGEKDYRSREIVNAAGTGNGSQKGTFILGDSAVTVTFNGDYIIDDIDLFTRNKTGGAAVKVEPHSRVVFGDGVNVTSMKDSKNHTATVSPTLDVEYGAHVFLYTLGFDHYEGTGTIVVSDELIASGEITSELFAGFFGNVVDMRGEAVVIPKIELGSTGNIPSEEYDPAPTAPALTCSAVCYVAHSTTSGLCTSSDSNDGQSDTTSKYNWGKLTGKGTMSVLKDGGTAIITGRGMFGVSYTFEKAASPVLITAVYGDADYRSHEIVNAAGTGNGSQKGTFILGDSAVTVSFAGDYILDNVDIFTRNKTGGATITVLSGAKVVFGGGANITNMQSSSNHKGTKSPALKVESGGYVYLHTLGFDSYTGTGTIVLDRALVESGKAAADTFTGFDGSIIFADGSPAFGSDASIDIEDTSPIELEDGAIYKITSASCLLHLTAEDFGVYDNAPVVLTGDEKDMSQLWRAHRNADGTYSLENMACGSYLCAVSTGAPIAGTLFSVRTSGSADKYKSFYLRSADGSLSSVVIENSLTGFVALSYENADASYSMINSVYGGVTRQTFSFEKVSDGKGQYPQLLVLSGDYKGSASCPEIIYCDGVYYNYNMTGAITVKTSTDLVHWNVHHDRYAFERPSWLTDVSAEGAIWAPGCYRMGDKYYLYYCTSSSGSRNSAIGVAVSDDPSKNDWKDLGQVLRSYVYDGWQDIFSSNFNAIDPNVVEDGNGNYYLVYGSYWNGIHMRRLDPNTGMLHPTDTAVYNIARGAPNIEAGYIIRRDGYYYLFVAKGSLAGGDYYWAVGRSETLTGPYLDRDGVDMLEDGGTRLTEYKDGVVGVGHAQYFEDTDGQGYMVSESWQYRSDSGNSDIQIHISSVVWTEDGWPVTVLDPDVMGTLGR